MPHALSGSRAASCKRKLFDSGEADLRGSCTTDKRSRAEAQNTRRRRSSLHNPQGTTRGHAVAARLVPECSEEQGSLHNYLSPAERCSLNGPAAVQKPASQLAQCFRPPDNKERLLTAVFKIHVAAGNVSGPVLGSVIELCPRTIVNRTQLLPDLPEKENER